LIQVRIAFEVSLGDDREAFFTQRLHRQFDVFDHDGDGRFAVGAND